MGSSARVKPLPPQPRDSPPHSQEGGAPAACRPKNRDIHRLIWTTAPLLCAVVAWSLAGRDLVGDGPQRVIEVAGILLLGAVGLLLAMYVKSSNSQVERAYSAHLEELSQRLRSLAYRDSLTDLYNHRFFHDHLSHEVEKAYRYGRPVSVILLDLDRFKEVNDTYGHLTGDRLLALVGQVISNHVRGADIAARYGGDEFAIILPETSREAAESTARKLAKAVASGRTYVGSLNESLPLSASYGVACCPDEARTVTELLQLADDRLYVAKDGGLIPKAQMQTPL